MTTFALALLFTVPPATWPVVAVVAAAVAIGARVGRRG